MIALPPLPSEKGVIVGDGLDPEPEHGGYRHGRQHMGNIELPERQPVAHIGPGHILDEIERQAFAFGKSEFGSGNQNGGVDERDKTGAQDFLSVAGNDCRCACRHSAV